MYFGNRHNPECATALAQICWWVSLIIGGAFVAASIVYSAMIIFNVRYGIEDSGSVVPQTETLSRERLQEAIRTMEQRALEYDALRDTGPSVVDPSR